MPHPPACAPPTGHLSPAGVLWSGLLCAGHGGGEGGGYWEQQVGVCYVVVVVAGTLAVCVLPYQPCMQKMQLGEAK